MAAKDPLGVQPDCCWHCVDWGPIECKWDEYRSDVSNSCGKFRSCVLRTMEHGTGSTRPSEEDMVSDSIFPQAPAANLPGVKEAVLSGLCKRVMDLETAANDRKVGENYHHERLAELERNTNRQIIPSLDAIEERANKAGKKVSAIETAVAMLDAKLEKETPEAAPTEDILRRDLCEFLLRHGLEMVSPKEPPVEDKTCKTCQNWGPHNRKVGEEPDYGSCAASARNKVRVFYSYETCCCFKRKASDA